MSKISDKLRAILWGTPFGEVFPAKENPPPLPEDGRTIALRILRDYVSELVFYRLAGIDENGKRRPPIPFQIEPADIYIEWPDNEENMRFPSLVFLSTGPANYNVIGLTSYVEEGSKDVYGPGTVLQWMSEYTEKVSLEIWASKKSERRAILAGLETALTPTEQMYGLRFRMPNYYNELVCFTVESRELIDDGDAVKNRRHARVTIEMRFNVVALVNYVTVNPFMKVDVDSDADTGAIITLDPNAPTDARPLLRIDDARPNTLPRGPLGGTTPFDKDC